MTFTTRAPLSEARHISVAYGADKSKFAIKDVSLAVTIPARSSPSRPERLRQEHPPTESDRPRQADDRRGVGRRRAAPRHPPGVALVFQSFCAVTRGSRYATTSPSPWRVCRSTPKPPEQRITQCIDLIGWKDSRRRFRRTLRRHESSGSASPELWPGGQAVVHGRSRSARSTSFTAESLRRECTGW